MGKKPYLKKDSDHQAMPLMSLSTSHDIDGTAVSVQSAAIDGEVVRIVSLDNLLRIEVGSNPVAVASSIALPALGEIWLPMEVGHKVAVLGGKANICTAGI